MRIHTYLTENEIRLALLSAKRKGRIADDVHFDPIMRFNSRSREHAWEVQLGASNGSLKGKEYVNQYGKKQKTRRTRNAHNMAFRFSATWHEWGWFLAEIYDLDSAAICGPLYKNKAAFDSQTKWQFNERYNAEPPIDPIVFYTGQGA